jgi:ABC-2 type transport system permease protein
MSALATPVATTAATDYSPGSRRRLLFVRDYQRLMTGRVAWLLWAMIAYTVLVVPFILTGPQEEFVRILAQWIGHEGVGGKIVLFIWIDAAMNKLAIVFGAVLAGGIIADEKARGSYDILLSKPIAAGDYYLAKIAASLGALATFYAGATLGAVLTFPFRVPDFPVVDFLALSSVHIFAALFSASFAGFCAVAFGNRLVAMLASIVIVGLLVGLSFLGFYNPALYVVGLFNPFFHGVALIGRLESYGIIDILMPIAVLIAFNLGFVWLGRQRAIALIGRG